MTLQNSATNVCTTAQMQRLFTEMDDCERLLPLHVGLDPSGDGSAFIARNFVSLYPACCPRLCCHEALP